MEPEESGILPVGLTTSDTEDEGPPLVGSTKGPIIVVTTADAITALTAGAVEVTQIVGMDGTYMTDTL